MAKEPNFAIKRHFSFGSILGRSYAYLDYGAYAGEYSWHLSMNLVLLRLISYSIDSHWAATTARGGGVATKEAASADEYSRLVRTPLQASHYR